ncbi:hypothetical protein QTG56_00835 [Rossellomorea sp. AcN35-11]|nr:hypothetical protein [Rossellomorea aquimaris]WJV29748.1 hypothetical protein QTG56_00835 [Rossellomorea sp. AcN35-11]
MNLNQLLSLFNRRTRSSILNMLGRKRRTNRTMIWGTVLSLAMSAAAYGLNRRSMNSNIGRTFQNLVNTIPLRGAKPNLASINEFANELAPDQNQMKKQ